MRWMFLAPTVGLTLALAAGCKSETNFTPFQGFPELDTDHGQWLSMAVAPEGSPLVAFYDKTHGALGFAVGDVRQEGIAWAYEEVDGYPDADGLDGGDAGTHTDMTVAPDGTVWISYHAPGQGQLRVARRAGGAWTTEVVDNGSGLRPKTGLWTSIAVDASGEPVVIYHDEVAGTLRMARRVDGQWSTDTIFEGAATDEREADAGEYAQLLIDGNTHYITFYDRGQQELVLLEGFAGAYVKTVVDSDGDVGQWPSLVKEGETLAVAYHDVGNQDLRMAVREGGTRFTIETLDDGRYRGADTALFRRDDRWGVVYFDGRENDARLLQQGADATWTGTVLGEDGAAVGFHNEVVQDGTGRWWTASYDYTNRRIRVQEL